MVISMHDAMRTQRWIVLGNDDVTRNIYAFKNVLLCIRR